MQLMTSEAGNRMLLGEPPLTQFPRTFRINWRNQVAYPALEVHAMTSQTVIHQKPPMIMRFVKKNLSICDRVRSGRPILIFLAMTALASRIYFQHIILPEMNLFGNPAADVAHKPMKAFQVRTQVGRKHAAMTTRARNVAVGRSMPFVV